MKDWLDEEFSNKFFMFRIYKERQTAAEILLFKNILHKRIELPQNYDPIIKGREKQDFQGFSWHANRWFV